MHFTSLVAAEYGDSVFYVLEQDADMVILLLNYFISKSEHPEDMQQPTRASIPNYPNIPKIAKGKGAIRKRVTSKTATGGWF